MNNDNLTQILTLVAELELESRRKKLKAGMINARKNGKTWGGSKPGWRKVSKEQIDQIIEMKINGVNVSKISRIVNLSRPTIYHVLKENHSKWSGNNGFTSNSDNVA